jgi:hypothetical protein
VLNREVATRVKKAHDRLSSEHTAVKFEGGIREFDKDKQTFILRNAENAWRCAISEELYDDAWEAFTEDARVTVLGRESKFRGVINVLSIESARTAPPDPAPSEPGPA